MGVRGHLWRRAALAVLASVLGSSCVSVYPLGVQVANESGHERSVYCATFTPPLESRPMYISGLDVAPMPSGAKAGGLMWGVPGGFLKVLAFDTEGKVVEEWTRTFPRRNDHLGGYEFRVSK